MRNEELKRRAGADGTGGNRSLGWAPTSTGGSAVGALLTVAPKSSG